MEGLMYLIILLIITCISEIIPLLFIKNRRKWINTSLLCNVITNPIMNTILAIAMVFVKNNTIYIGILVVLEIIVIIFEAFIYHNVMNESFKKCIILSAILNIFSFAVGLLIVIPLKQLIPDLLLL